MKLCVEECSDDASLVLARVADEISALAITVEDLQCIYSKAFDVAVADATFMIRAQELDFLAQSLRSLSMFLKAFEGQRVGRDALDIEKVAKSLPLESLARRLAGENTETFYHAELETF